MVSSGQGASCFKWPWDSVAIVPTSIQRLQFTADQVTSEKVGVQVKGLAVYRIAEPLIAFRMLNFSFPERASEKLQRLLEEMFIGAARRLVANLTVEECLSRRKEGIAGELMREISPVLLRTSRTNAFISADSKDLVCSPGLAPARGLPARRLAPALVVLAQGHPTPSRLPGARRLLRYSPQGELEGWPGCMTRSSRSPRRSSMGFAHARYSSLPQAGNGLAATRPDEKPAPHPPDPSSAQAVESTS